jgi:hypothetical protein
MISVRRRRPPRGPGLRRAQRPPDHPPENLRDSLDRNAAYTRRRVSGITGSRTAHLEETHTVAEARWLVREGLLRDTLQYLRKRWTAPARREASSALPITIHL